MGLAEGTELVNEAQARACVSGTRRDIAVICCVVMATTILLSVYLCCLAYS